MDVITEKPRPVVPHCGACCGASGPGQGAHAQYRPARSEAVTWPTGPGSSTRRRWRGPARLRDDVPNRRASHATARDQTGPGSSTRRRWRGPARIRDGAWLRRPWTPEGPGQDSRRGLAAAAVDAGGAWPGFKIDHSEPSGSRVAITRAGHRPQMPPTGASSSPAPQTHTTRHAPPDTRPEHHPDPQPQPQTQQKAGRNLSVPARPRYSATIGATRQVAPRGRWCHATGEHQCATAVSCQ